MGSESVKPLERQFDLTGKVALITGASGHLGRAMATALAEAGASVVVASREQRRAEEVVDGLPGAGVHHAVVIDYLDEASIDAGFDDAVRQAGSIDILVNNGHAALPGDWTDVSGADFNRQLANATGYFLLSRRLRDHVVAEEKSASIVMLGSMYGVVGSYPEVYRGITPVSPVAYHALKGGIVHMTRHLAVAWAADRIRVNCLGPGPFPGPAAPAQLVERLKTKSPLGRMGRPDELKGPLLLLVSDAGSYMTGHHLLVDGGWTAW